MNRFLDNIEKYKFAILGTVLFHVVIFMFTNFVTLANPHGNVEEIIEIEIDIDAVELDEEMLEMLNRQNELNNEQLYNLAADQNDSREESYENFSTQEIDQQVEDEARLLEEQFYEEWANTHTDSDNASSSLASTSIKDPKEDRVKNDANPNKTDTDGDKAFAGQVMVSFSLKNRDAHRLKIPGYTCYGSGTVVIDIKVDKSGNVKNAEYNPGLSSGATSCMVSKAKRYANQSRFSYDSSGGGMASGTITYKFQGQ